jgi:hypothetical protein
MACSKVRCASNLSSISSLLWCASLCISAILKLMPTKVSYKATKSDALIVIVSSYSSSSSSSVAFGSTAGSGCVATSGYATASSMSIGSGSSMALGLMPSWHVLIALIPLDPSEVWMIRDGPICQSAFFALLPKHIGDEE